ncbi:DUF4767 domain-containing protein [Streptococcus sp. NLN64]|uniref:DUF4767 domain-containing protein n=1 Tax=Streptococcus sp. NLN64 TaxID=2822799 RepID=UPI0018CB1305|nr:DUF4767 domain-containing protein [Streptococcus sp. NLN64]MBG9367208.1 DUF4767 domain-containing protein [Streptococcus sp. NLN64]
MNANDWSQAFEQVFGRKPTPEEFMRAKQAGFPQPQIAQVQPAQKSTKGLPTWVWGTIFIATFLLGAGYYVYSQSTNSQVSVSQSVNQGSEEVDYTEKIEQLSEEEAKLVSQNFGKWLYDSPYGQDAVTVRSTTLPTHGTGSAHVIKKESVDGDILAGFGWTTMGSLEEASNESNLNLIEERDKYDIRLLGMKGSSDQVKDFTDNAILFKIYSLKGSTHAYYNSTQDEFEKLLKPRVPDDQLIGAAGMGQVYLAQNLLDKDKETYTILLASNGKVYYTKKDETVFQEAPEDMQEAYHNLLKNSSSLTEAQSISEALKEEASSTSENSGSDKNDSSTETAAPALWDSGKEAALADFMVSWGNSMNQPGYENKGTKFIDGWSFNVGGSDVSLKASSDGRGDGDYNVVANYQYLTNSVNHIYYFAFDRSGSPIVLYTNQWDGPVLYLKPTANADLANGFASIANQ